jgi:IS30 family transposase
MNYTHLAYEERYQIYALKKAGHDQKSIAKVLGRHPATISRELGRNSGSRGYRPKQAQRLSEERRAVNARCIDESAWQLVDEKLQEQWSPDQISGHVLVSHETIYQHYRRQRQGICKTRDHWQRVGSRLLLCPPLLLMGTWNK